MYFRGESTNHEETACCPAIFRIAPKEKRTAFERDYYKALRESFDEVSFMCGIKECVLDDEDYTSVKLLGIFQHYGLKTRLLDITKNKMIALYFASCSEFTENGKLYYFSDENSEPVKTSDAKCIARKMECIEKCEELYATDVKKYFEDDENSTIRKYTIENNVVIDYKTSLGTTSDCLRYDRQEGVFILFGNLLKNIDGKNHCLSDEFKGVDKKILHNVKAEDKFEILLSLCIPSMTLKKYEIGVGDKSISKAYIFPDDDDVVDVLRNYCEITNQYIDDNERGRRLEKYIETIYSDTNVETEIKKILEISQKVLDEQYYFAFVFLELHQYCSDTNVDVDQKTKAIEQYIYAIKELIAKNEKK